MQLSADLTFQTEPGLALICSELAGFEPLFHRPEHASSRADFEKLMAPQFCEIGASGRRYNRSFVLDELERRHLEPPCPETWQTRDFFCQKLAPDLYQLTYLLLQSARTSQRTSIWRFTGGSWQIVFHQGTIVHS